MAPRQLHLRFVDRAAAAMVASVESYNKPSSEYRDEAFALLVLNAWEILLKARIIQINDNELRSIYVYETRTTKVGKKSKKRYLQRTAAGNARTVSVGACVSRLEKDPASNLPAEIRANLAALSEIRNNAAHCISSSAVLQSQVGSIAAASVKNFVVLARRWFELDLSDRLSLVLPLAFLSPGTTIQSVTVSAGEGRLIEYLREIASSVQGGGRDFDVAVTVDVSLRKSKLGSATRIQIVDDPAAAALTLTEEDILKQYPWTYDHLSKVLSGRYANFSMNAEYHRLRKSLAMQSRYCWVRQLDPRNPASGKKQFFSPAVLDEFDKHYKLKGE